MVSKPRLAPSLEIITDPQLEPGQDFEAVELGQINWAGAQARKLGLDAVRLDTPNLTGTKLPEGSWLDVEIRGAEGGGLDVSGLVVRRLMIAGSRLSGVVLSEAELRDVHVEASKLDLANFRFANLKNVVFTGCDLTEADFSGATLTAVGFVGCILERASFDGAKMYDVDLTSSTLLDLKGITGLAGATIGHDQLAAMAPAIAFELGIKVKD